MGLFINDRNCVYRSAGALVAADFCTRMQHLRRLLAESPEASCLSQQPSKLSPCAALDESSQTMRERSCPVQVSIESDVPRCVNASRSGSPTPLLLELPQRPSLSLSFSMVKRNTSCIAAPATLANVHVSVCKWYATNRRNEWQLKR